MKTIVLFLGLLPFMLFQKGCSGLESELKDELTSSEIKLLKKQPDFIKQELVNIYNENGSLDEINLVKSELNGEEVYFIGGTANGSLEWKLLDNSGKTYRGNMSGKELNDNAVSIIGDEKYIGPPPMKIEKPSKPVKPVSPKKPATPTKAEKPKKDKPKATTKPGSFPSSSSYGKGKGGKLPISDCMQEKIDFFVKNRANLSMSQIYAFESNAKLYFMFDEGMAVDGAAYVLSESCDTICTTGGMRRGNPQAAAKCPEEKGQRRMIWVKGKGFVN